MGVLITNLAESGAVITVMRDATGVYAYRDPLTGRTVHVTRAQEKKIGKEAYCFYRPLPLRKIKLRDLIQYMLSTLSSWDIAAFVMSAMAITLVGMVLPKLNHILMGEVVTYGSYQLLGAVPRRPEPQNSGAPVCRDRRQDRLRKVYTAAPSAGL